MQRLLFIVDVSHKIAAHVPQTIDYLGDVVTRR